MLVPAIVHRIGRINERECLLALGVEYYLHPDRVTNFRRLHELNKYFVFPARVNAAHIRIVKALNHKCPFIFHARNEAGIELDLGDEDSGCIVVTHRYLNVTH